MRGRGIVEEGDERHFIMIYPHDDGEVGEEERSIK